MIIIISLHEMVIEVVIILLWSIPYTCIYKVYIHLPRKDGCKVSNEPFRGVESKNTNSMETFQTQCNESLCHGAHLLVILAVGCITPFSSTLHTQSIHIGEPGYNIDFNYTKYDGLYILSLGMLYIYY